MTVCKIPPGSLGDVNVLTVLGLELVVRLKATPESGLSEVGLAQRPFKKCQYKGDVRKKRSY